MIFNKDPMTTINFMGLLLCLTGITCHVIFKFSRNAQELDATANGTPHSQEIHVRETFIGTEDDNFPLLDKVDFSREYDTEEDH